MIITFNGDHGSGKSTIARMISKELGYDLYYTGKIFREFAKEKGITYAELMKKMEKDETIDRVVDQRTVELGKEKDKLIFDSRMAWYFIPHSLKIFFKVNEDVAAKRIFNHLKKEKSKERMNEDENFDSIEKIKESNRVRKLKDNMRYQKLYNVDIWNEQNYDFVIDTTEIGAEEVYNKTLDFIREKFNE